MLLRKSSKSTHTLRNHSLANTRVSTSRIPMTCIASYLPIFTISISLSLSDAIIKNIIALMLEQRWMMIISMFTILRLKKFKCGWYIWYCIYFTFNKMFSIHIIFLHLSSLISHLSLSRSRSRSAISHQPHEHPRPLCLHLYR